MMRFHNTRTCGQTVLFGTILLIALSGTALAAVDGAVRVTLPNGLEGVESIVSGRSETQGSDDASPSGFVHLRGTAEFSRGRGLVINGQRVKITRSTSVFPGVDGVNFGLRARQLSGRELTVFGANGANGVEAVLVIVKPKLPTLDSYTPDPSMERYFVPSETDSKVGLAVEGAPE